MKRLAGVLLGVALACACGGEPEPAGDPPSARPAPPALDDAIPIPERAAALERERSLRLLSDEPRRVFLNFDGEKITKSWYSDAASNTSFIGAGAVPAFDGSAAQRAAVVARVQELFGAYRIEFVSERPAGGDYVMVVVGGTAATIDLSESVNVVGVAPLDCADDFRREVAFAFSDSIKALVWPQSYPREVAETIAHELGHTFGLPHTTELCDLMSYGWCAAGKTFFDQALEPATVSDCGLGTVNPHQLLLARLGPASVTAIDPPPVDPPPVDPPPVDPPPVDPPNVPCSDGSRQGTCEDIGSTSCAGGFTSGLCPGPNTIKCCLAPAPIEGVGSGCRIGAASGVCLDTRSSSCGSGFRSGHCPGPSAVQCCLD